MMMIGGEGARKGVLNYCSVVASFSLMMIRKSPAVNYCSYSKKLMNKKIKSVNSSEDSLEFNGNTNNDTNNNNILENYKSDDSNYKSHVPVLVRQCCALLEGRNLDKSKHSKKMITNRSASSGGKKLFIDATFGAGGYTREILRAYPGCKVIGIDTDYYNNPTIKENEKLIHEEFGKERLEVHCVNFREIKKVVQEKIVPQLKSDTSNVIDGIVFDLGVSSMQLDQGHRGFSFLREGPLGMF